MNLKKPLLALILLLAALPAAAHVNVFGPKAVTAAAGAPQTVSETFTLAGACDLGPNAAYTLVIGVDGVSSASIRINGAEVVKESDFSQQVTIIERAVTLAASNTLSATLKGGSRNGSITITIRRHIDVTEAVFGEKTYTTTGKSDTFRDSFSVANPAGTFSIVIRDGATPVRSAEVRLNGVEVTSRQAVTLRAANELVIDTKSDGAGASLRVAIVRHVSDVTGPQITHGLSEGQTIASSPLTISGTVTDPTGVASFTVNGTPVTAGPAGAFTTSVALGEGSNTIRFNATDCEGNSTHREVNVLLEVAPTLTITAPAPNALSGSLTIAMIGTVSSTTGIQSVTANGAAMTVSGTSWSGNVTLAGGADGARDITVVATDTAGRQTTKSVTVRLDTTGPVLGMSIPSPEVSKFNIRELPVGGTVSDTLAGVQRVTCNGAAATIDAEGIYRCDFTMVVGANNLTVVARDQLGNETTISRVIEYVTDNVRPTITAVVTPPANASGWHTTLPFVSWDCQDNQVISRCPLGADILEDGANMVLTGAAVDGAGNEGSATIILNVDTKLPAVEVDVPQEGIIARGPARITGSFSDDTSGVKSVDCHGVAAVLTVGAFECTVPLAAGSQTLTVTVTDHAGNSATRLVPALLDTRPPALELFTPAEDDVTTSEQTIEITGSVSDDDRVAAVTVGGAPVPVAIDEFVAVVNLTEGANAVVIAVTDRAGNVNAHTIQVRSTEHPDVRITTPDDFAVTSTATITVSGTVSRSVTSLDVNGIPAQIGAGTFTAPGVPLAQGRTVLTATARGANGQIATDNLNVYRDSIPPRVVVYSPSLGEVVTASSISVTGMVDDIVIGTINAGQVQVKVNGVQAQVANRAFVAGNVPLTAGTNVLNIEARDQAGNTSTSTHTITLAAAGRRITLVSGNAQTAAIGAALAQPLRVRVVDQNGAAVPNQEVTFSIVQNDGTLSDGTNTGRELQVTTGSDGQASVNLTLGHRAGAGNNRVRATAAGFDGAVEFHANASTGVPALVVVDMGSNQFGVSGELLPRPLVAVVVDAGSNRLANVPVTFSVLEGDGSFGGQPSITVLTDSDGRAEARPLLGPGDDNDNNRFAASVANVAQAAMFTVSGRRAGAPSATRISGVVMDNMNQPIAGVTLRIDETTRSTTSNSQGFFAFEQAPVGYVKLIVDGTTAQRPGTWPTLEFVMYTNSGQDNTIGMPVYLLPIDVTRGIQVTETTGGTLTFPELPGFALTVAPGSALFPNGSRAGTVSATLVHADKMPMTPGFGQQPRFIVTIQPPGVHFDPPAKLTLPNLDGLAPGEITELYSFDHDLGQFIAIGTGTVSEDGTTVVSDPGVGIVKGGWHCGGNPNPTGSACTVSVTAVATVTPQELPPATEDLGTTALAAKTAAVQPVAMRPKLTAQSIVSRRIRSNAITGSHPVVPVGGCATLTATGNPALGTGGLTYDPWEFVPGESDGTATAASSGCSGGSVCKIRGVTPGVVTYKIRYRNASGQQDEDKVQVRFVDLQMSIEEFSVDNDVELHIDDPKPPPAPGAPAPAPFKPVADPIWKSTNLPGENGPLMITKTDALAYRIKIKLNTALPEEMKNVGFTLNALGGGMTGKITGRTNIPANQTTFEVKVDKGKLQGTWKSQIIPSLLYTLEALPPTDCPFPVTVGSLDIKAYSAGRRPAFKVYLSILHLATDGTAVDLTNQNQLLAKVWNKFKASAGVTPGAQVRAWDGNPTFKYYPTGTKFGGNATDLEPMLSRVDGASRCGAFAPLMGQALALNGLDARLVLVRTKLAPQPGDPYTDGMLVKNWTFGTTPSYPSLPVTTAYPFADKFKWEFKTSSGDWEMAQPPDVNPGPYGDIESIAGAPGMNSDTPSQKAHVNHAIINVGSRFYDSSYGLEYASEAEFETKALDGYFTVDVPPAAAPAQMLARQKPYGVKFWIAINPYK
jgi:Glucodextranase, domain B